MDPSQNPFAPGAGTPPPELAGRESIVNEAKVALARVFKRRPAQSQILLGLRGVGKTVLLNRIEQMAEDEGYLTSFIEARDNVSLPTLLYPRIHQVLRKLSAVESAKAKAITALRGLRSFAAAFKVSIGDVSIAFDPEPGVADSGIIEEDLTELFLLVGEAAASSQRGWALLIDEVQYLSRTDLSALIVAIHRTGQKSLPIIFFGAGLPQLAGMAGDAKSYAERLFTYPGVGELADAAARSAIVQPIEEAKAKIDPDAVEAIIGKTRGFPYFLQEWGFQAWNHANGPSITIQDVEVANLTALRRLDDGFFNVRLERLTPKERDYVFVMAGLGDGPYRSTEVARCMGEAPQSLGPLRAKLISKGMVYSPAHGDISFTVPMFADFIRRHFTGEKDPRSTLA